MPRSDEIDISGLDKAEVLAALYNASRPQGMGMLHFEKKGMTKEEAATYIGEAQAFDKAHGDRERLYFDYLKGRVMKIDLGGDSMSTRLYDRDNGEGAAARALQNAGLIGR
jgi:hypothetical protein